MAHFSKLLSVYSFIYSLTLFQFHEGKTNTQYRKQVCRKKNIHLFNDHSLTFLRARVKKDGINLEIIK